MVVGRRITNKGGGRVGVGAEAEDEVWARREGGGKREGPDEEEVARASARARTADPNLALEPWTMRLEDGALA